MAGATTPDGIGYATTGDAVTIAAATALVASTTQTAFALRQRYEFVWANAAARTSQTGMVNSATGYQVDTKTEYIYESSTWRLKTPHAEFTATSASTASATQAYYGTFTLDTSNSTSSVMATPGGAGIIVITDPGIYLVSAVVGSLAGSSPPITGRSFLDLNNVTGFGSFIFRQEGGFVGGTTQDITLPNLRVASSNFSLYFSFYWTQASGATTFPSRVRITRLG